ncbi:hypothetical protein [Modicisalibacter coralii]|uniref:hypothetical protein n=1 Tax=Modicisalibacter coralii TaxID=2304602 RepID=UPI00100A9AA7|nr:hypothetical protein [Halomonas coralii]
MPCAFDNKTRAILPEEGRFPAIAHEAGETARYRQLALRFLTYHPALSRLLETLAEESRRRALALASTARGLQLLDWTSLDSEDRATAEAPSCGPFFVTDEAMASALLADAQQRAEASLAHYRAWLRVNAVTAWQALLETIVTQKSAECRILQESQPGWREAAVIPLMPLLRRRRA